MAQSSPRGPSAFGAGPKEGQKGRLGGRKGQAIKARAKRAG